MKRTILGGVLLILLMVPTSFALNRDQGGSGGGGGCPSQICAGSSSGCTNYCCRLSAVTYGADGTVLSCNYNDCIIWTTPTRGC